MINTVRIITRREFPASLLPALAAILILYRRALTVALTALLGLPSSLLIGIIYFFSICLFTIYIFKRMVISLNYARLLLLFMISLYLVSLAAKPNNLAQSYFKDFLLYCMVGAIFISSVDDYAGFIKCYCVLSLIIFAVCAPLPFITGNFSYHNMGYYGSGMVYGDWVLTPCFLGVFLLHKQRKRKLLLLIMAVDAILILLFASRSCILTIAVFIVLYDLFIDHKRDRNTIIKLVALVLLAVILFVFLRNILQAIQNTLSYFHISSRALMKYLLLFQDDGIDVGFFLSGRDTINQYAIGLIRQHPLLGIGIGTFPSLTGAIYTHNFFTDALSTFGLIGGIPIILIAAIASCRVFAEKDPSRKRMMLLLFVQCFPRLFFSKTFVNDTLFWMFVVFAFSKHSPKRIAALHSLY